MYRIEDKPAAIRAVQRYLLIISQVDFSLPHITVDGIYSDETRSAVSEFQKGRNLSVTGSVDIDTFTLLATESGEILLYSENRDNTINEALFPLRLGDSNSDVAILNAMLSELSVYYRDINLIRITPFFSLTTESGVKVMQRHLKELEDGTVSHKLFARLREELNARKNFRKPS